ncbi:MAG TPA: pyridoxamine 5'-phosphate oxidase family protein [Gemmatimonadaceae bacterium]|nr:pyridoxamine 5'-phosphate oxidase family protein [Gemmatimonadaceae bacterium]
MTAELLEFMRAHRLAVEAPRGDGDSLQAPLVGIAVTESLELIFDTLEATRKVRNLRRTPTVAFVLGGWTPGDERTMQYEGIADEPTGA